MKPQSMSFGMFFKALCLELQIDHETSNEDDIIRAIQRLKMDLCGAERASEINYLEWQKLANQSSK